MVSILTLGSKVLGFFREMLMAAKFGSGVETDTFLVAYTVTYLFSVLLMTAIANTFVPVLAEVEEHEGKEGKVKHTSNMINITLVVASVLIILAFIFAPLIIRLIAKGFYGEQFDLAVKLTRVGLPMILFSGVVGSFTGYLHSERRYLSSAALGFPLNIVYIIFLLFFSKEFGIIGLMAAIVTGTAAQLLIQLPAARRSGYSYSWVFDLRDVYVRRVLRLSLPVLVSVTISDLNTIVDRALASGLVAGSISALNYGNRLNVMVYTVFITAVTTVIFPILAKEASQGNMNRMKQVMSEGVNLILLITIPATVGMVVLAQPIVEVVFERGEFTAADTQMTKYALIYYSLGLVASSIQLLLIRVYYSLHDTKTPTFVAAASLLINFGLNVVLIKYMAHAGLAFATSIANTLAAVALFYILKRRIGSVGTVGYIKVASKAGLASAIMGAVAYAVYRGLYTILGVSKICNLVSLLAAVISGALVYLVFCYVLRVDQARDLVDKLKHRLKRTSV